MRFGWKLAAASLAIVSALASSATCTASETEPLHSNFAIAFKQGASLKPVGAEKRAQIEVMHVGQLKIPSGEIVACDPSVIEKGLAPEPFLRQVEPGTYGVDVSLIDAELNGKLHQSVACARVLLGEKPAVRWVQALKAEQETTKLEPGKFYGYEVTSGLGSFSDASRVRELAEQPEALKKFLSSTRMVGLFGRDRKNSGTIAAFRAGAGDGFYPSFWGLDDSGKVVSLVTDFRQLLYAEPRSAVVSNVPKQFGKSIAIPDLVNAGFNLRISKEPPEGFETVKDAAFYVVSSTKLPADLQIVLINGDEKVHPRSGITDGGASVEVFRTATALQKNARLEFSFPGGLKQRS